MVLVYLITRYAFQIVRDILKGTYVIPSLSTTVLGDKFQFERLGNLSGPLYLLEFLPVPLGATDCHASI
jgi:hypothetical protein